MNKNLNQKEEIVKTFQTETGDFILKRLVSDWYSVRELSKLWVFYKNFGLNLDIETINWVWKNKKKVYNLWSSQQQLKGKKTQKEFVLKSQLFQETNKTKEKDKGFMIYNPLIHKLLVRKKKEKEQDNWFTYGLVKKEKITKVYKRIRKNKEHEYPSTTERYKADLLNLFTFCLEYLIEKKHKRKRDSYESAIFNVRFNENMIKFYKYLEEQEEKDFKKALESLEGTKEKLKLLLENKDIMRQLFYTWVTNKEDINFIEVVKRFVTKWFEINQLKNCLPTKIKNLLEELEKSKNKMEFLEEASNRFLESSEFLSKVIISVCKKEAIENVIKPRVKFILFCLMDLPDFVEYLMEERKIFGIETFKDIFFEALQYLDILKPSLLLK